MKLYAWVDNGQLFTTEDKNLALSNAIEFEVESFDDLIWDGTQIRLKTQDEKLQELKSQKLSNIN